MPDLRLIIDDVNPIAETISDRLRHGIVCFGGEDWWYHNRGHCDMQLMRQFARLGPVLYINSIVMRKPNVREGRMFLHRLVRKARSMFHGLVHVPEGFWVYSPITAPVHHLRFVKSINQRLLQFQTCLAMRQCALSRPLVWVNCPAACDTALAIKRSALVYQRTDRYEEYPGVDAVRITHYDRQLKHFADLTFFSSRRLYEQEHSQCRSALYVDHGVDFELFAYAEQNSYVPPEMRDLPHPIAGFFGGIDRHTFNLDLMSRVVAAMSDVTFVFVGKNSMDCACLSCHSNVRLVGQRPYEQIPHYGKCFDVCLMPWNRNSWIDGCNPIKLKEYLALGKPVVSTPFPQLVDYYAYVGSAESPEEFACEIRKALKNHNADLSHQRREFVRRYSWQTQAMKILHHLDHPSDEALSANKDPDISGTFPEQTSIRTPHPV